MIYATTSLLGELTRFTSCSETDTDIKSPGQQFAMQRCVVPRVNGGVGGPQPKVIRLQQSVDLGDLSFYGNIIYLYIFNIII